MNASDFFSDARGGSADSLDYRVRHAVQVLAFTPRASALNRRVLPDPMIGDITQVAYVASEASFSATQCRVMSIERAEASAVQDEV